MRVSMGQWRWCSRRIHLQAKTFNAYTTHEKQKIVARSYLVRMNTNEIMYDTYNKCVPQN